MFYFLDTTDPVAYTTLKLGAGGGRILGSSSTRVFEARTAIGREHFACLDPIVTQIFTLLISNGEKILSNVNVVVRGQVKSENSSLPAALCV